MNAARRNAANRGFPRGLYCRDGWYYFRTPAGKTYPIGRVSLAVAKMEAIAANQHLESLKPSLLSRMTGATNTIAQVLETMPISDVYNTAKTQRSLDNRIRSSLGAEQCHTLTVAHCAAFLEGVKGEGKHRLAAALRTQRGFGLGRLRQVQVDQFQAGPRHDIGRREHLCAVKAAAVGAGLDFGAIFGGMAMGGQ